LAVTKYQKGISDLLLDRIDINIEALRVDYEKLSNERLGKASAVIRQRVEAARHIQRERFADLSHADGKENSAACNSDVHLAEVRKFCKMDETSESLMRSVTSRYA